MAVRMQAKVTRPPANKNPGYILINAFGNNRRPGSLLLAARAECVAIAREMAQEMRDSLYKQRFKMAPLTAKYLAMKVRKGLDKRTLLAYKKYVRAIGYVKTPYGGMVGITKKFREDTRGSKTRRIPYWKLQRWLEFGTRKRVGVKKDGKIKYGKVGSRMPARPHWRPMLRVWKKRRKDYGLRIKRVIGFDLKQKLRAVAPK